LNSQLELLTELQFIDLEIDQLEGKKKEIPKEVDQLTGKLEAFVKELEALGRHIEEINKLRRKKEGEVEQERELIKKSQEKLREVKTNKEYSAMLKEIELNKGRISALEDEILNYMVQLEEEQEKLKEKEGGFQKAQEKLGKEKEKKQGQIAQLDRLLIEKAETKSKIASGLEERSYLSYLKLREGRNGIAVVNAKDCICQGCYMKLPPQIFNEIRKNDQIIHCIHCNRILFWANS
jgi:predicted  nucleic acid-binding Zn-ribbon protein